MSSTSAPPYKCHVHNINVSEPAKEETSCSCPDSITIQLPDLTIPNANNVVYGSNLKVGLTVPLIIGNPPTSANLSIPTESIFAEVEILNDNKAKLTRTGKLWDDFWVMIISKRFVIVPTITPIHSHVINNIEIVTDFDLVCFSTTSRAFDIFKDQNYDEL